MLSSMVSTTNNLGGMRRQPAAPQRCPWQAVVLQSTLWTTVQQPRPNPTALRLLPWQAVVLQSTSGDNGVSSCDAEHTADNGATAKTKPNSSSAPPVASSGAAEHIADSGTKAAIPNSSSATDTISDEQGQQSKARVET